MNARGVLPPTREVSPTPRAGCRGSMVGGHGPGARMGQHIDAAMNTSAKMEFDVVSVRVPAPPGTALSGVLRRKGDAR